MSAGLSLAQRGDAIVAIATAAGRGAVGIVRVSGPRLSDLIVRLCGRSLAPRVARYGPILDHDGSALDHGLAIHFPAPHSYTGEDVLELQAHGGPVLLQLIVRRCLEAGADIGVRLAEPGEFTQRAFLNGKLDLAQAEAVSDLIDASTEAAVRSAGRSMQGDFSLQVNAQAEALVRMRTLVEATLDFPEEDIDVLQQAGLQAGLQAADEAIGRVLGQARQGALLRQGLQVVLSGQPNVGKSSLLNALAGAELAIVTPIPGTTRDRVSETIQVHGVPLHVTDTAGLRELDAAADDVERIGIGRSWGAIEQADVVLFLRDATRLGDAAAQAADAELLAQLHQRGAPVVMVLNKIDAWAGAAGPGDRLEPPADTLRISAHTGEGLEDLRQRLLQLAGWQPAAESTFMARERHLKALQEARRHVQAALAQASARTLPLELLAEELRLAHEALGSITGAFSVDDLLGEIFSRFCIGK